MIKEILIIEDNKHNELVLKKSLETAYKKNYIKFKPIIYSFASLKGALFFLKYKSPDLIILDLRLPDCKEKETFYKIQEVTTAPIIIYSCVSDMNLQEELIYAGAKKFIPKPIMNLIPTLSSEINDVMLSNEILYK